MGLPSWHASICNVYTPDFTAGSQKCSITTYDEKRSRADLGGLRWRSVGIGPYWNDITIRATTINASEMQVSISHPDSIAPTIITIANSASSIEIGVDGLNSLAAQLNAIASGVDETNSSAILAAGALVIIPAIDEPGTWNLSEYQSDLEASAYLSDFVSNNLSGGEKGPVGTAALSGIRTGPVYSMARIGDSEQGNADGSMSEINKVIVWDGNGWIDYDLVIAYDPDAPESWPC